MQKIIVVVGPTAVGKTSLAIKLAQQVNGQIISGDSMQIYREVSIGTAKATEAEQAAAPHLLINQKSVFEEYSVKDFVADATEAIDKTIQIKKTPIICGGTGFYINALINKLQLGEPGEYETSVEPKFEVFLAEHGPEKLWQLLQERDPQACEKIPVENTRRVLRALTVIDRTGEKFSQQQAQIKPRYDALLIGLNSERQLVYDRINKRVDIMMTEGLLDEAKFIYENRAREYQILQAIGYKEFFPYFEGTSDLNTCVEKLKQASRKYAKRQLTYFRNKLTVNWYDSLNDPNYFEEILTKVEQWQNE
ncbi:tRNA (adenosine(37)-N6)-dimethylallyltransferase MiaA [Lactobacillus mulieris]|uniref:tRNA (adenosine(37)-N6)-dimethylallyltransferase MiaA n=1 Tax=Lactobacillus mulieris TaxID=2508708 RepID=UPI00143296B6|nr:tRNA (adenosine(37)-N6)-dimethylallyltransferase MiaA [Lactobacillus mulieris]MCF1783385.1 tRNA (adenosine(37)-N6)-dimethylallyltransferase MiaA [Lactobacillus mulieris]MCW8104083.1 tRNA (adenosine(37)-N6)-dimethylallyltransferase MiaA [Lactobacillus mulieris]MDK6803332.1 tRNA (adenosine(37)-N6)-dimethylallyltransferase MiaA [Lactobacillus mulieris]MDK8382624.1 tRNA (adenosine(37)-N6)-dimethylallyltransferase MiaA [Lactobacillus mulieris]MDT9620721.1 tRNA (adenosine(37)-N6)-dimethylallyltra